MRETDRERGSKKEMEGERKETPNEGQNLLSWLQVAHFLCKEQFPIRPTPPSALTFSNLHPHLTFCIHTHKMLNLRKCKLSNIT